LRLGILCSDYVERQRAMLKDYYSCVKNFNCTGCCHIWYRSRDPASPKCNFALKWKCNRFLDSNCLHCFTLNI